ncbi:MAG: hypothetical protein L0170_10500, partial [Acidobacteria bacterium]|nr:hypothetical protein [Acidobacteriota bacterium]
GGASWSDLGGSGSAGGISNSTYGAGYPSLAIDPDGNPVVAYEHAWIDPSNINVISVYLRRWNGTSWVGVSGSDTGYGIGNGAPYSLGYSSQSALEIDASGNAVVAWNGWDLSRGSGYENFEIYLKEADFTATAPSPSPSTPPPAGGRSESSSDGGNLCGGFASSRTAMSTLLAFLLLHSSIRLTLRLRSR